MEDDSTPPPFSASGMMMSVDGVEGITAFEYFNDVRFFAGDPDYLALFVNKYKVRDKSMIDLRAVSRSEFYKKAWETCKTDDKDLKNFFHVNILACDPEALLEDFYKWKKDTAFSDEDNASQDLDRMVNVGYQIQESPLSHDFDLISFTNHINTLIEIYKSDDKKKDKYVGPYFCFVQSSGMGKTKLLWEYKTKETDVTAFVILPKVSLPKFTQEEKGVFDFFIETTLPAVSDSPGDAVLTTEELNKTHAKEVALKVYTRLDEMLSSLKITRGKPTYTKIALLFDESQKLLDDNFGYKAFLFRCIRVWLREDRTDCTMVAVFTGTNSKLTNFLFESDEELQRPTEANNSREWEAERTNYYPKGGQFFLPFYRTTTTGSCLYILDGLSDADEDLIDSEYKRAVFYGRPLFAQMAKKRELDGNIGTILLRMVRDVKWHTQTPETWIQVLTIWINLLSTRVQLGQTSTDIASELVARCYGNFFGFFPGSRSILLGYSPDPVCARLAMCMMDGTYKLNVITKKKDRIVIKGQDHKSWTEKLKMIFSSGLISPDKGNFGEVVVALYMLFCGDLLRKQTSNDYSQFSVSLDDWLQLMISGGKGTARITEKGNACKISVGFIQVCRNSLRSYSYSWKHLTDQCFLKHVYESGIAFYTCNNCPLIDMVVPLRIQTPGGMTFVPMLVSIKCHASFPESEVEKECVKLKSRASRDGLKRALCLLIVFGSSQNKEVKPLEDVCNVLAKEDEEEALIATTIRVPLDDDFGLSALFNDMTPPGLIDSELLSASPFVKGHGKAKDEAIDDVLNAGKALYSHASASWKAEYTSLRDSFLRPKPAQVLEQPKQTAAAKRDVPSSKVKRSRKK